MNSAGFAAKIQLCTIGLQCNCRQRLLFQRSENTHWIVVVFFHGVFLKHDCVHDIEDIVLILLNHSLTDQQHQLFRQVRINQLYPIVLCWFVDLKFRYLPANQKREQAQISLKRNPATVQHWLIDFYSSIHNYFNTVLYNYMYRFHFPYLFPPHHQQFAQGISTKNIRNLRFPTKGGSKWFQPPSPGRLVKLGST